MPTLAGMLRALDEDPKATEAAAAAVARAALAAGAAVAAAPDAGARGERRSSSTGRGSCCARSATPRRGARWSTNTPASAAASTSGTTTSSSRFLPYVQRFLYGEGRSRPRAATAAATRRCACSAAATSPRCASSRGPATRRSRSTSCTSTCTSSSTSTSCCSTSRSAPTTCALRAGAGAAVPLRPRLPGRLGRAGPRAALPGERRMARRRRPRAGALRCAAARGLSRARVRAPRAAHRRALGLRARAAGQRPLGARRARCAIRQIEYYRMPMMAYLALDDPRALTRNDFIRLGLVTGAARARDAVLPYAEQHLADFEQRYCYDRFWADAGAAPNTRYLCNGHALVVVGDARSRVLLLPRPRRAGAVPPPALPAVPDRALPEGGAADVLGPAGRGAEAGSTWATPPSVKRFKRAIRAQLRRLPALHAPLLVPRDLRAGAGARAVRTCAPRTSGSTRCTPR